MDFSVLAAKPQPKPANEAEPEPANEAAPEPAAVPDEPPPPEIAPPSQTPAYQAAPPRFYDPRMGGAVHCIDQISRVRRVKNAELIHSRTYRMNFGDDPCDYCRRHDHDRHHGGHGLPPPPFRSTSLSAPPHLSLAPPPPYYWHTLPPPTPIEIPQALGPPPAGYPPHMPPPPPPMGVPSAFGPPPPPGGYPHFDGYSSDEDPNGCTVM